MSYLLTRTDLIHPLSFLLVASVGPGSVLKCPRVDLGGTVAVEVAAVEEAGEAENAVEAPTRTGMLS